MPRLRSVLISLSVMALALLGMSSSDAVAAPSRWRWSSR
ncbi:hypothetical protein CLV71_11450 [Actinophytocola oryzae]|uniref:Uncharacterized protein n=1 Tax=Actinophytocola oryzae TaxID=502181 RepID=A0A4V6Q6M3_9PSEU|nr:hypothetical protein CLV71_11450 [Actinophytocola oryzae]